MRVLAAAAALVMAAASAASGCNVSTTPEVPAEVKAEQERQDAETRKGCEAFKREVGGRVDSPDEFGRVFDQMARDAGAPDSFRDTVRKQWGDRLPNPEADPEQFKKEMDKLVDKCESVGAPIE